MRTSLLDDLRCPFCGGALDGIGWPTPRPADVDYAVLSCWCCAYPVVEGIPILALGDEVSAAIRAIERRDHAEARRLVLDVPAARVADFEALRDDPSVTFADAVRRLLPDGEGDYYALRFGDPTFVAADALVRDLARRANRGGRVIDVCGGCGHLTWSLAAAAVGAPTCLLDRSFWRLWIAARYTAPSSDIVCCDANTPVPLRTGCASLAVCNDAAHYVWGKRLLVTELERCVAGTGTVALTHVHSALGSNATAGNTLTPAGYAALFNRGHVRVTSEQDVLRWAVDGTRLPWHDEASAVGDASVLALVASAAATDDAVGGSGDDGASAWVVNPLLSPADEADTAFAIAYPSGDYAEEFGDGVRSYLPAEVSLPAGALHDLAACARAHPDLAARRVLVQVPARCASGYVGGR